MPSGDVIARKFSDGGAGALAELLGAPFPAAEDETIWVFESRRKATRTQCDPPGRVVLHDQIFRIVRVIHGRGQATCLIEGKEFIGEELITVADALQRPGTPLGFKPRPCGTAAR